MSPRSSHPRFAVAQLSPERTSRANSTLQAITATRYLSQKATILHRNASSSSAIRKRCIHGGVASRTSSRLHHRNPMPHESRRPATPFICRENSRNPRTKAAAPKGRYLSPLDLRVTSGLTKAGPSATCSPFLDGDSTGQPKFSSVGHRFCWVCLLAKERRRSGTSGSPRRRCVDQIRVIYPEYR
jgi:hypothetical protein